LSKLIYHINPVSYMGHILTVFVAVEKRFCKILETGAHNQNQVVYFFFSFLKFQNDLADARNFG